LDAGRGFIVKILQFELVTGGLGGTEFVPSVLGEKGK
jgi:hypothetical protein